MHPLNLEAPLAIEDALLLLDQELSPADLQDEEELRAELRADSILVSHSASLHRFSDFFSGRQRTKHRRGR